MVLSFGSNKGMVAYILKGMVVNVYGVLGFFKKFYGVLGDFMVFGKTNHV